MQFFYCVPVIQLTATVFLENGQLLMKYIKPKYIVYSILNTTKCGIVSKHIEYPSFDGAIQIW
jgi:hypothetical protein